MILRPVPSSRPGSTFDKIMRTTSRHVLIIDDDPTFARVMTRAFRKRDFDVISVRDGSGAIAAVAAMPIDYIVLDLMLSNESGLSLIQPLRTLNPDVRILILTGFASTATAVDSIKAGAYHYLVKPASIEEIMAGLGLGSYQETSTAKPPKRRQSRSVHEIEWAHILQTLRYCDGNVSATARMLKMHLRTLQRKIAAKVQEPGKEHFLSDIRKRRS